MDDLVLAIDIGGTKMAAGLVDPSGHIVERAQCPTLPPARRGAPDDSAGNDGERLFESLVALLESLDWRERSVVGCGVGCGGPMKSGGEEVSPLNIPAWRSFPLHRRLEEVTGLVVAVDNDAKALALGEGWKGAAASADSFIAMVVSTGVGGGIVLNGHLLDGRWGNAGHIGHLVVEPDGRLCGCGARGCLEAEASGPAIEAAIGIAPVHAPPEVVRKTGTIVGRAVAMVSTLLDLDLAVVAGSVALGFGDRFFDAAQDEIDRHSHLDYTLGTVIRPAALGHDGPLVGAAAVGWRNLGHTVLS